MKIPINKLAEFFERKRFEYINDELSPARRKELEDTFPWWKEYAQRIKQFDFLPFEEARAFARSLNLKSWKEWNNYCESGKKPINIPRFPHNIYDEWTGIEDWLGYYHELLSYDEAKSFLKSYKISSRNEYATYLKQHPNEKLPKDPRHAYLGQGWVSWGDYLGTGYVRDRSYCSYKEAIEKVRPLGLKNKGEWFKYYKEHLQSSTIPFDPQTCYGRSGEWISWYDFLGTRVGFQKGEYLPFEDARKYVRSLKLSNQREWQMYLKSKKLPPNIPSQPSKTYEGKWISLGDWLGTGYVATTQRTYRPFENARKYIRSLKLKSNIEWDAYKKSGKLPSDIRQNPYKYDGWLSMEDWLGTRPGFDGKYLSYEEGKQYVQKLGIKSIDEWVEFSRKHKDISLPTNLHQYFNKTKEWISAADFFGTKPGFDGTYRPFEDARRFVHSLKLKSVDEWNSYTKSGNLPVDIPKSPRTIYEKSWVSFCDWLGKPEVFRKWRPFKDSRKFARSLHLKSQIEWRKFDRPHDVPSNPNLAYKSEWRGWQDFLGTEKST